MRVQFRDANGNVIAEHDQGVLSVNVPVAEVVAESPQGLEEETVTDDRLRVWTTIDRKVHVDGEPYHWGVADWFLMWDHVVYSYNDDLEGYVSEKTDAQGNHVGWNEPIDDPREGGAPVPPDPVEPEGVLATTGDLKGNVLTVDDPSDFAVGDRVIVPPLLGRGSMGPGGTYPERLFTDENEMWDQMDSIPEGNIVGIVATGLTWVKQNRTMNLVIDQGHWYLGHIVPRAFCAMIVDIQGNRFTLDHPAVVDQEGSDVFYDGSLDVLSAVQELANRDNWELNLNKCFPNWKRLAINGRLIWQGIHSGRFTCDDVGSFELFSPKGTPCISVQWLECQGIESSGVSLVGNWGDDGYGFNWSNTTTNLHGYHGALTDANPFSPAVFPSGHEFWGCDNCVHKNATVYDVPNRASGGESNANCWTDNVVLNMNQPLRQYVQWMFQYGSTRSKCGTIDCHIESVALVAGYEIMHGHGDHIRASGVNATMAMNNASGTIDRPQLRFTKDCIVPLEGYPAFWQSATGNGFGAPAINLNLNSGQEWAAQDGITLIAPMIDQGDGYLDSNGCNLVGIAVQALPNFKLLEGLDAYYPAQRVEDPQYGGGAVALQCYAPQAYIDGKVHVEGECINQANNFSVYVTEGVKGSNLEFDVPTGGVCFNWEIS